MSKIKHLVQNTMVRNIVKEFVVLNSASKKFLAESYSDFDKKSKIYSAIQLGEQLAYDIQVDLICEYYNDHPVLKEDIFQRGLARTKAYLTTPLGAGFTSAKNQQMAQNLINTFKKNTEKIVNAGPNPFTPTAEDQKNSTANIAKVGSLIGQRFANLTKNPKLTTPPTPAEVQAGMGKIQQLTDKLKSSGFIKNADTIVDEIGIFARQHPKLTNLIVAGLTSALTIATAPGWLAAMPLMKKFLIGTALRTVLGISKGETPQQAAAKAAAVAGSGIAVGKLLGLASDKLSSWLGGQQPAASAGTDVQATPTQNFVPQSDPADQVPISSVIQNAEPQNLNLTPKINALNSLMNSRDIKGAAAPAAHQAMQNWINSISKPEADAIFRNPELSKQLFRKGAYMALKQKFGLRETKKYTELDYLKTELMADAGVPMVAEANPFTTAKNLVFGGPKIGGDNARLDYKQVESDYLKLLNNLETQFGVHSEKDVLDMLKRYDKVFPGAYDYAMKVRSWLYGPSVESTAPTPDPVSVPPQEIPTPNNPNPVDPQAKTPPPGTPPATLAGANIQLDANKIKTVKLFLSRLIDVGESLKRANPNALNKAILRDLVTNVYNFGDVMVNKNTQGKINGVVDQATQGLDLLGQQPKQKPVKPVANVFKEADSADSKILYKNAELTKQISALKNNPIFTNLPQRLQTLMAAKHTDARSLQTLRTFLSIVYNAMIKNSAAFQQAVGNPSTIKKELESDKEYLKEATSSDIQAFVTELGTAVAEITKLAGELRQAFNRKNPNSVYATTKNVAAAKPTEKSAAVSNTTKKPSNLSGKAATLAAAEKTRASATPEPKKKAWENESFSLSDYKKFFI